MSNSKSSPTSRKKKNKLQRKVHDFSQSIGLSPLKIIVSGVLLLGIGFLIFSVAFSDREVNKVAATPSEMKLQQQELSLDQRLAELIDWQVPSNQNFLTTIDQVYDVNDELTSIESNSELSDYQKILIDRIRLQNKSVVVMMMARNKISCDTEKADLIQTCKNHLESSDEVIREKAKFWLCFVPTVEFSMSPSKETLEGFVAAIETYPAGYLQTPKNANTLSRVIRKITKNFPHAKEYWKEGLNVLAKKFETSEVESIRELGEKLYGLELFGEFNLPTLGYRILWGDPSGPKDLEGALAVLSQNPQTDLKNWVVIIKAYEGFLSTDKIEETGSAWQRLSELVKNITDPEKKKTLQGILARQRTRAMAIGTQFDPTGTEVADGKPIALGEQDYTAIIFCDKSVASFKAMMKLGTETKESQLRYRPVLAFENELTEADIASLDRVPRNISIVDLETATRYYKALPVDFFPYVVLLDKKGTIISANLEIQQIPTRIAKFDGIERRARAARNESEADSPTFAQ